MTIQKEVKLDFKGMPAKIYTLLDGDKLIIYNDF